MKPNDYVKKYDLQSSNKFNHNHFVQDLTTDFLTQLEITKTKSGEFKIKGFDNTVNALRMKWDAIDRKTVYGLPEKLWNYFYATVVVKVREELFPEVMQARKEDAERRKREYEERKRMYEEEQEFFNRAFFGHIFRSIFKRMSVPTDAFEMLELSETATEIEVKESYRKLAMSHHPDKGGKQDTFVKLTEAKNKCLSYIRSSEDGN